MIFNYRLSDLIEGGAIDVTNQFTVNTFPAGEKRVHFSGDLDVTDLNVYFVLTNNYAMDIMVLAQIADILENRGAADIYAVLPYLPYARQDRYTTEEDSFALQMFTHFLYNSDITGVFVVDAHSEIATYEGYRLNSLPVSDIVQTIIKDEFKEPPVILLPDAGATKKLEQYFPKGIEYYVAEKVRDPATGRILDTKVPEIPQDRSVLIVDDISDGGRTFIEIAKRLTNTDIRLYVTHGVFSKPDIFPYFNRIYTTDSFTGKYSAHNVSTINLQF